MTVIDLFIGALLVFGLIRGYKNGLIVEFASLISFFVGIYLAIRLSSMLEGNKTVKLTVFVIVLILVIVGIHLLAKTISKVASSIYLGGLNKIGGSVLGFLRKILFLSVLLTLFQKVNLNHELISKKEESKSFFINPILKTSVFMLPVLSNWYTDLKKKV